MNQKNRPEELQNTKTTMTVFAYVPKQLSQKKKNKVSEKDKNESSKYKFSKKEERARQMLWKVE